MLTASIVIYKTQKEEFRKIVECSLKSSIHTILSSTTLLPMNYKKLLQAIVLQD